MRFLGSTAPMKNADKALMGLTALYVLFFAAIVFAGKSKAADIPGKVYTCTIDHVLDGDTIKVLCPDWPEPFMETSLRVFGIDTPESSARNAKCKKELKLGLIAKAWARHEFFGATQVRFVWAKTVDKWGGRIDARVTLPSGKDWADEAIRIGFARPYGADGNLTKSDWCR
jgi:endonuclease YncB( thermonuclease family)